MARVDRRGDDALPRVAEERGGEGGQRRDADDRNAERQSHRPRQREADPDAGERAGSRGDGDAVERGETALDAPRRFFDHGRQGFGVPARHDAADDRQRLDLAALDHRDRGRAAGGIDRQDAHGVDSSL